MRLLKSFDKFIKNHVNLNETRLQRANDAFDTLTSFLEKADETAELYRDTSRQGSLRQGTIIKPRVEETEFDVDLLLRLGTVDGWDATAYLDLVHSAFKNSDRYEDLVDRRGKHRCVTIDYVGDFHVDVVPSIERDGQCWVMNRETNEFEVTDGDGYAEWFAGRHAAANGMLVKAVRLVKYMRDEHEWPVKSILLTTLLGQQVSDADSADDYPDVPTSLRLLIDRLNTWLQEQESTPEVSNPALPEELFTRHWDDETFGSFRDEVKRVSGLIGEAYDSEDEEATTEKWREVFADSFSVLDEDLPDGELVKQAPVAIADASHARPLNDIAREERRTYTVRIDAAVYNRPGKVFFQGINSGAKVMSNRAINFKAWTNAREPFEVHWQVVNTGRHAASKGAQALRGGFFQGKTLDNKAAPKMANWEVTEYTGSHWIECFIVQDGVCVGRSGRFVVNVKNPEA